MGDVLVLPVSDTYTNMTPEALGTAPVAGGSCCAALFSHLFLQNCCVLLGGAELSPSRHWQHFYFLCTSVSYWVEM